MLVALGVEREVDHHDCVLFHDANQQDDSDQRDHSELTPTEQQRENRTDASGRQRRENRDRMNVALVEDAQHDVNSDDRCKKEPHLVLQRRLKRGGRSLKGCLHAERHCKFLLHFFDGVRGLTERGARSEVERNRHRRKLSLTIDGQRRSAGLEMRERA